MPHITPKFTAVYIALIVAVNYAFSQMDTYSFSVDMAVSAVVGLVFIARDYAQREIGHWVLGAMLAAGVISYFMASPEVALASVTAFLISEVIDWGIYTFTKRPLSGRILLSSAAGAPIDTVVFLAMIDQLSAPVAVMITGSKMAGALIVWFMIRRREAKKAEAEASKAPKAPKYPRPHTAR